MLPKSRQKAIHELCEKRLGHRAETAFPLSKMQALDTALPSTNAHH